MQLSKTVYFRDYAAQGTGRSGLTIPFSDADRDVYQTIAHLSSYRLRKILGYELYADLEQAALGARHPVATFARMLLRKNARVASSSRRARAEELQATS